MKHESYLLSLYVCRDENLPSIRHPFLQDGKVCSTDGKSLIRIDRELCEGKYELNPEGAIPPKTSLVVPKPTMSEVLTMQQLQDALDQTPDESDFTCPECEGRGQVWWQYKSYQRKDSCPECGGTGDRDKYDAITYQYMLYDIALCYHSVKLLIDTMRCLETDHLYLRHATQEAGVPQALLFTTEQSYVEIVLMPQKKDKDLKQITIST